MHSKTNLTALIHQIDDQVCIVRIHGEITLASKNVLNRTYVIVNHLGTSAILLDFTDLSYMNSSGIGLLVSLLVRANRQGQELLAFGLNEYYRQIFEITHLDKAICVFDSEVEALAAVGELQTTKIA